MGRTFIRRVDLARPPCASGRRLGLALLVGALAAAGPARADVFPGAEWASATPSELGLDAAKLQDLADLAGGSGLVVRAGYVAYSWGSSTASQDWASASKAVMSTLLWMAADTGLTTVDTTVGTYLAGGSEKDRSITFRHLANMISGYSRAEDPGEAFAYNDHAINLYGHVLFEHVYGDVPEAVVLSELSFLGFQDPIDVSDWQFGRIKSMSVRDFARIGHFWLNRGNWNGTQVLDPGWFDLLEVPVPSSMPLTTDDGGESWDLGTFGGSDNQDFDGPGDYAWNFWVNGGNQWPGFPTDIHQAVGYNGSRVCWVIPEHRLVVTGVNTGPDFGGTPALQILYEAVTGGATATSAGVEPAPWSRVKAGFRQP
jgi:CubicO group peptidase (beta-lactamase class C family)